MQSVLQDAWCTRTYAVCKSVLAQTLAEPRTMPSMISANHGGLNGVKAMNMRMEGSMRSERMRSANMFACAQCQSN